MRILAIDTALDACAAAILDTELETVIARESMSMARGHAEALMPLLERVLALGNTDVAQLDRIAVTTGPGSFTGLRVGIAAARGLGLAANKPVVGLSTLSAYAAPHIAADDTLPVAVAIDARHGHVYLQVLAAGGRTIVTPRVVKIEEAARLARGGKPRVTGNAANLLADVWPTNDPPSLVEQKPAPDIDWVARLGAAANETASPPKPLYIRAPDAQPQNAAQLARR